MASFPSINIAEPLDGDYFCYLLNKSLLKTSSLLCLAGSCLLSSSSGGGRRERMKVEELVVGLWPCGSLVGVMH